MGRGSKIIYIVGSVLIGIIALLIVLFALIASGAIDARQTKLVFASESESFVYDGTEHHADGWSIVDGELRDGHTAIVTVSGSQLDAGESENYFSVVIKDSVGADVTDKYDLEYQFGTLTVVQRAITITSHTHNKIYDGTPLVCDCLRNSVYLASGELAEGQSISYRMNGDSLTNFGTQLNGFTYQIVDSDGRDVTYNYAPVYSPGRLSVDKRTLQVKSKSGTSVYDGRNYTYNEYEVTKGQPVVGQNFQAVFGDGIRDVGTIDNEFSLYVYDADNNDISSNYFFDYLYGTLEVTPRVVTVITDNGSKIYDGTPLMQDSYTLDGDFAPEQVGNVVITGEQTYVGSSDNVARVSVSDAAGNDVSANYTLKVVCGTLTVEKRPITISTSGDEKIYDGKPLVKDEYELESEFPETDTYTITVTGSQTNAGDSDNTVEVTVYDDNGTDLLYNYEIQVKAGKLTVRPKPITITTEGAEREYNAQPLTNENYELQDEFVEGHVYVITVTGSQTDAGQSENTVEVTVNDPDGYDMRDNYAFTINCGILTVTPLHIDVYTDDAEKTYDGTPLTNEGNRVEGPVVEGQTPTVTVTGTQTDAGTSPNTAECVVRDADQRNVSANYDITINPGMLKVNPIELTVKTNSARKEYDGEPLVKDGHELIGELAKDQHEVIEVIGTITDAGMVQNEVKINIYDANSVDVTANYDIIFDLGSLEVTPLYIQVQTQSASKTYDGTPLTAEYSYSGKVLETHSISFKVTGSQLMPGSSTNTIEVQILDDRYRDVTKNYEINKEEGVLEVIKRSLTVITLGAEKTYDGTPLENPEYSVFGLADGHTATVNIKGLQLNAGECENDFEISITDAGGANVIEGYEISSMRGILKVNPIPLSLMTVGGSKPYDGTPLENSQYRLDGELLFGHTATVTVTGSQTEAGRSENTANVVITDENGTAVTRNYDIYNSYGLLTVTKRDITVITPSKTREYDGTVLTARFEADGLIVKSDVAKGQTLEVLVYGQQQTVGSTQNSVIVIVSMTDANGDSIDVTQNYNVEVTYGTLTVTARKLIITTNSASQYKNGSTLKDGGYSIIGSAAPDEEITVEVVGSQADIGSSANRAVVSITDKDGNSTIDNYDITYEFGTLTVLDPASGIANSADNAAEVAQVPHIAAAYGSMANEFALNTQPALFAGADKFLGI